MWNGNCGVGRIGALAGRQQRKEYGGPRCNMAKHSVNVPDGPGSISWGWLGGCEQHAAFSWPWGLSYWPSWRGGLFAWGIAGASNCTVTPRSTGNHQLWTRRFVLC